MSALAAVVVPLAAVGSGNGPQPSPALPTDLDACFAVAAGNYERECLPQVELGSDSYADADFVAMWANMDGKLCCFDGAFPDPNHSLPLPWRSSPRRTTFRVPHTDENDLHIAAVVRLLDPTTGNPTTYFGEEYFTITGEPRSSRRRHVRLTPYVQSGSINVPLAAERALNAREALDRQSTILGRTGGQGNQPHFGPAEGIHLTFVNPPAPGSNVYISVTSAGISGPTHGIEPLHAWLWVVDVSNMGSCANPPPLSVSQAFCNESNPPFTIPVPTDFDVTHFDASKMSVPATNPAPPNPPQQITIVGYIRERTTNPTSYGYRFHYGTPITVAAPGPTEYLCVMQACTSLAAHGPNP
jgi:hypothetical protein